MNARISISFLFAASLLPAVSAAPPVRLAISAPRNTSLHKVLLEMREKWLKASNGAVSLVIYTDGTQGEEAAVVQRMRVGALQAGMLTVVGLSEIDRSVTALQYMPMMFRSLEEVEYVRERLKPELEKRLLAKGFVPLFWGDAGWVRWFSKKPALTPADFRKLKLFVWEGDTAQVELMKNGGFNPVPLPVSTILQALQTGMIDAVAQPPFFALAGQIYRAAPNMLELNWAPMGGATVITKSAWDGIPAEVRAQLLDAARVAGEEVTRRSRLESDQAVAAMCANGLKVHSVTPEIEAQWRQAAEEFYPKIRGGIVPAEMFDRVRGLLDEFRKNGSRKAGN